MFYIQEHIINEYGIGKQTIRFVIADTYSELFLSGTVTNRVSIFDLGTLKQDLNLSDGKFAIDELNFTVNESACIDDPSKLALTALKESVRFNTYCAVNILSEGETATASNSLFIGKITQKININDKAWRCADYSSNTNAISDYSFTAQSMDISLLDNCLLTGEIKKDNAVIPNLYDRIDNYADAEAMVNQIGEFGVTNSSGYSYFRKPLNLEQSVITEITNVYNEVGYYPYSVLGAVYLTDALNYLLTKSQDIIKVLTGEDIILKIAESDLGLQVAPILYDIQDTKQGNRVSEIHRSYIDTDVVFDLCLGMPNKEAYPKVEPLINARMLFTRYGFRWYYDTISDRELTLDEGARRNADIEETISEEMKLSFWQFKSVSELLYKIASEFNCYLTTFHTIEDGKLCINIKFVGKSTFLQGNEVKLRTVTKSSNDSEQVTSADINYYYSIQTANSVETQTLLPQILCYNYPYHNKDLGRWENYEDYLNKFGLKELGIENAKINRSLFATSNAEVYKAEFIPGFPNGYWTENSRPVNTGCIHFNGIAYPDTYKAFSNGTSNFPATTYRLTTNLYIKSNHIEAQQQNYINSFLAKHTSSEPVSKLMRPVGRYFLKINGNAVKSEDGDGGRLSGLRNQINGYEKEYYKSEISLEVATWNGFKSGETEAHKNLKLGSIVKLNGADYVVVSKEINLQKPTTNIRLHSSSRFAYSKYKG